MTNFGSRFLATLGVALLAFVAIAVTANATTLPAPRAFTASLRTSSVSVTGDVLLVKVYAADHKSGITYTCTNPTETNSYVSPVWNDTWSSNGTCRADRGDRRAVSVTALQNFSTDTNVLYVRIAGFLPYLLHTYRYKCVGAVQTSTYASTWYGDTYAAVKPCSVG
jgi:hypothetical protein